MKVSIVIPLYNEVANVGQLQRELLPVVRRLSKHHWTEVVFIDDGSADGTYQALEETFTAYCQPGMRFEIVQHSRNRGLGAALRTGFGSSHGEVIITADSDGSYRLAEIPALLSGLVPTIDIVTASPYHPEGRVDGVPAYRLILSRGCSLIYGLLVDRRVRTYTCMFRAYRRAVVRHVVTKSDGHLAVAEILAKAILLGCRVVEVPAVLQKRTLGSSKAKIGQTIRDHLRFQADVLLLRLKVKPLTKLAGGSKALP